LRTWKWRLLFLSVSGLALTLLAVVCVQGMASLQRRALESATSLLEASTKTVEAELNLRGRGLAELSEEFAADPDLPGELQSVGTNAEHRVDQFHGAKPEIDAITLMNESGVVVGTNAHRFHVGENLVAGRNGNTGAMGPPGLLDSVLAGYPSRGISFLDGVAYHWGAAPISVKGTVIGAVLMERRLQSLPDVPGCEAFLVVNGKVALGKAREGWRNFIANGPDKPFLLLATESTAVVPLLGEIRKQPMFVDPGRIGIWAQRFHVPGSAALVGFVTIDLTPLFSELAGFQLMFVILVMFVWLAHAALLFTANRQLPSSREQLMERLLAPREWFRDFWKGVQPPPQAASPGNGVAPFGEQAATDEQAALEEITPPLGERVLARLSVPSSETAPSGEQESSGPFAEDATSAMPMTPELMAELGFEEPAGEAGQETQIMGITPELLADMKAGMEPATSKTPEPDNPIHRDLYEQFTTMRKRCGESDPLPFEQFMILLEANRAEVMAKHNCQEVSFHVLVQAGKAVLTATPGA
jgi:hypothetical protein